MRKYRLERTDLNQLKIRTTKGNIREKEFHRFTNVDEFLLFINDIKNSNEGILTQQLLRIIDALESNSIFIRNVDVYNILFKRFGEEILKDDIKIKSAYIRIATILCTNMKRFIRMLQNNQDIVLLRILYTSDSHLLRAEVLHYLAHLFSIFACNNLQLLKKWWRFQFFMQNAIQCLIELVNIRHASIEHKLSNETSTDLKSYEKKEKLSLTALAILLEIANNFPFSNYHLQISNNWFIAVYKTYTEQSHLLHGIMMKILNCWLDSPFIRNNGKYYLIIQQLFAPISEMIVFQGSKIELTMANQLVDSCKYSMLSLLNCWSGLLALFAIDREEPNRLHPISCFRIFDHIGKNTILTPNIAKVQCCIIDLVCELLALPYANREFNSGSWEKEFKNYKNIWLSDSYDSTLSENFLLSEVAYIDATLQFNEVDIMKTYRIVVLYGLINAGLHESLIRLILQNPDEAVSIKATFLLADLFRLSTNLPKNIKLECLSIYKLIQQTVNAFQSRTFRQLAENKEEHRLQEEISSLNFNFSRITDNDMEKFSLRRNNENYRSALLLIDRLEQINDSRNKPITMSDLRLLNFYLILDSEFRRKRGTSILSRHSSSTGDNLYEENKVEETIPNLDVDIDVLLAKAFELNMSSNDYGTQAQSNLFNITGIGVGLPIIPMQNQATTSAHEKGKPAWNIVWKILSIMDDQLSIQPKQSKLNFASKMVDKCVPFFNQIAQFFLPSNQHLITTEFESLAIHCGQFTFHLLCVFAKSSTAIGADNARWASDLLTNFLYDFCSHLNPTNLKSVFSPRNLMCSTSPNYFTILRILSSHPVGQRHFEQTTILQILLDRISSDQTSAELIKLIISSMNYFSIAESGTLDDKNDYLFARNLLENVLHSAKNLTIRKWSTRFLDSFFTLNKLGLLRNFDWQWTIKLLIRQLSDTETKIIRLTTEILLKWLPYCPEESIKEIKELLKHANLEVLDNLGNLLEVFIFNDLDRSSNTTRKMARISLQKWKELFYLRYVDIIEERMRKALIPNNLNSFCHKRSMDGSFARASNQQSKKINSRILCPAHLYGQLARSSYGQQLLEEYNIFEQLEQILLKFIFNDKPFEEQFLRMTKGAIFGLAHILSNFPSHQIDLKYKINYFTKIIHACIEQKCLNSPWLSIRGCAFLGLNIAAKGNYPVASILYELGWEFGENVEITSFGSSPFSNKKESLSENLADLLPPGAYFPSINSSNVSRKCSEEQNPTKFDYAKFTNGNAANEVVQRVQRRVFSESEENPPELSEEKNLTSRSSSCEGIKCAQKRNSWRLIDKISFEKAKRLYSTTLDFSKYQLKDAKEVKNNPILISEKNQTLHRKNKPNFISEKENSELIDYQKFLSRKSEYDKKPRSMEPSSFKNQTTDRGNIILPKDIQILFGNIFAGKRDEPISKSNQFYQPSVKKHNQWLCLYCPNKNKLDGQCKYRNTIIEHIYQMVNQLSNAETIVVKLLRLYESNPECFEDPCIFSDVLRIIADSRIGFEGRKLIYHLFWNSI